ncbi:conserved hypothetical protein [Ricinus communis]|uniref:Uncharacterized protein n=1 Tax=Ricinus communis TaxID=3988 RepID=B9RPI6_RICCO|nr:conserved hypothetical protein [Ricinus communis]
MDLRVMSMKDLVLKVEQGLRIQLRTRRQGPPDLLLLLAFPFPTSSTWLLEFAKAALLIDA